MPTNKEILNRGIAYAFIGLPFFFIGPSIIHSAFKNQGHTMFIPILGLGIILCVFAVIMVLRGIKTILKSQTDEDPRP